MLKNRWQTAEVPSSRGKFVSKRCRLEFDRTNPHQTHDKHASNKRLHTDFAKQQKHGMALRGRNIIITSKILSETCCGVFDGKAFVSVPIMIKRAVPGEATNSEGRAPNESEGGREDGGLY
ncbi:hypothetical protein BaRGS_00016384 [Batillaria attramentaria]|uniref:Uncharacterized protein n=1 Tax=Batillaria attramentaria TaxID=370345 RepID=A0ABD0KYJ1_9CAEN